MTAQFQSIAALAVVLLTAASFGWRALAKRGQHGCGGSCGCPSQKLQRAAQRAARS